ncbi:MAG: hypothetical protein ABUL45_05980 [Rhodanobacter sp.]
MGGAEIDASRLRRQTATGTKPPETMRLPSNGMSPPASMRGSFANLPMPAAVTRAGSDPGACEWAMAGAMPGKPRVVDALIGLLGHLPRGYLDDFAVEVAESWQAAPR